MACSGHVRAWRLRPAMCSTTFATCLVATTNRWITDGLDSCSHHRAIALRLRVSASRSVIPLGRDERHRRRALLGYLCSTPSGADVEGRLGRSRWVVCSAVALRQRDLSLLPIASSS